MRYFAGTMTSYQMGCSGSIDEIGQDGFFTPTALYDNRAAGMKPASGWWIDR
jgi:hypothetical protein